MIIANNACVFTIWQMFSGWNISALLLNGYFYDHFINKELKYRAILVSVTVGISIHLKNPYTVEYHSAIKRNKFESAVVRSMKLEPVVQSEVSQKEKNKYCILMHLHGI